MQRKELKKAIKEYSHKTNFYKLGLVRKLIQKKAKEHKELMANIPKIQCPYCKSNKIDIASGDSEYDNEQWLYCCDCESDFDDTCGYIDAVEELNCEPWSNIIDVTLHFEKPNIRSQKWKKFCEDEILKMLVFKKDKELF